MSVLTRAQARAGGRGSVLDSKLRPGLRPRSQARSDECHRGLPDPLWQNRGTLTEGGSVFGGRTRRFQLCVRPAGGRPIGGPLRRPVEEEMEEGSTRFREEPGTDMRPVAAGGMTFVKACDMLELVRHTVIRSPLRSMPVLDQVTARPAELDYISGMGTEQYHEPPGELG